MTQLSKQQVYDVLAAGGVTGELARIMAGGSKAEGNWDTEATGDIQADGTVCSWGLWQINRCGGLGVGYSEAELRDPAVQVAIMRPVYQAQYERYQAEGWTGAELAVRVCLASERPFGWMDPTGPAAQGYRRGYEAAAPDQEAPPMHFDPDAPPFRQRQDWTCSINTAAWCLAALGIDVTPAALQDAMVAAGLVSPADGLEDGSGGSLARWLAATFGVQVNVAYPADWAEVKDYAGTGPIALGGQRLNHWLAVRRPSPDTDALEVMNPAPTWHGIGTELSKAEWDTWGPWAAIYVAVPAENGDDGMRDSQLAIVNDEVIRNLHLAIGGLDAVLATDALRDDLRTSLDTARENLTAGALPAAQTLSRDEG